LKLQLDIGYPQIANSNLAIFPGQLILAVLPSLVTKHLAGCILGSLASAAASSDGADGLPP